MHFKSNWVLAVVLLAVLSVLMILAKEPTPPVIAPPTKPEEESRPPPVVDPVPPSPATDPHGELSCPKEEKVLKKLCDSANYHPCSECHNVRPPIKSP